MRNETERGAKKKCEIKIKQYTNHSITPSLNVCYYTLGVSTDYNRIFILFASLLSLRMSVYARSHMCVCVCMIHKYPARVTQHMWVRMSRHGMYTKSNKKENEWIVVGFRLGKSHVAVIFMFVSVVEFRYTQHTYTHTQRYTDTRTYRIVAVLWLLWDIRSRSDNRQVLSVRIKWTNSNSTNSVRLSTLLTISKSFHIRLTDRALCTTFRCDAK